MREANVKETKGISGMEMVYVASGDYLFPVSKEAVEKAKDAIQSGGEIVEEEPVTLGKYARMREDYLQEHDPSLYASMLLGEELDCHLKAVEEESVKRMDELEVALLEKYPAPDRGDMMAWTGHMNNLKNMAEEIVLNEIVYAGAK